MSDDTPETLAVPDAERVRELLEAHVPLTLIADLTAAEAVPSQEILEKEGLPEEEWWQPENGTPQASGDGRS
ncbi:hypothetical protein CTKZ_29030 [Cellulomonas algicola]|uniref:Uncharacterized protein n=1 Tax=Cellulomonas algicola TaxID=2071633 RepID=A0A401V386_9CELL|nr:hypothetical protein [Cellulomonas algicola]GCD21341.1 hypothetical protein CTKZ_29030 [Cellulomonas algicola]